MGVVEPGVTYLQALTVFVGKNTAAIAALGAGLSALGYGGAAAAVTAAGKAASEFIAQSETYLAKNVNVT